MSAILTPFQRIGHRRVDVLALGFLIFPLLGMGAEPEVGRTQGPSAAAVIEQAERVGEVTITDQRVDEHRIREYRVNGQLFMIRVTPAAGPAYYYVDRDGDGHLDPLDPELGSPEGSLPSWILFRW